MVNGDIFNAYSQYFNILENVGSYSQSNTARLLLMSFIQDMRNDGFIATLSDEDKKFIDKLEACIQDKVCIFPYTANCMKKKSYDVFAGDYEGCITVNKKAALQYPYAPNYDLDIYSLSATEKTMYGEVNINNLIITASSDYDLWLLDSIPGYYEYWVNMSKSIRELIEGGSQSGNIYFMTDFGNAAGELGIHYSYNAVTNYITYNLYVDTPFYNPSWYEVNYALTTLNSGDSLLLEKGIYYKITQPNGTFDVGLIRIYANGIDRNRTPDFKLKSHISCVTEGGKQTGYSVDNWTDENVFSPTYNQTEQRTTYNEDRCTKQTPTWEIISEECVIDGSGYNTGVYRVTRTDQNPNSASYGVIETVSTTDYTACPLNAPNWVLQSSVCQVDGNDDNTGYRIDTYKDMNPNSATYDTTRQDLISDISMCPTPTTDPIWQEISRACNTTQYVHCRETGHLYKTGTALVTEEDINQNSSTYGQQRTATVTDTTTCPIDYVGDVRYSDDTISKNIVHNYTAETLDYPLVLYKNDVLQEIEGNIAIVPDPNNFNVLASVTNSGFRVTLPLNDTGYARTAAFTIMELLSNVDGNAIITYNIRQTAMIVFKFTENSNTTLTKTCIASAYTFSLIGVTSTTGGVTQSYIVQSASAGLTATVVSGGISVDVTANPNTSQRNMTVVLKQNNSSATITLTVQQEASADDYVFTWNGGSVSDKSLSAGSDGDSAAFTVVSTKNGSSQGFIISSTSTASSFATASINGSTVTVIVLANTGTTAQSGYFLLRQNDSGNELKINVSLAAPVFVFSWPSGLPNPAPLTVSHTHGTYTMPVTSTRNGVNVVYTIDSVSSSISAWTISRNTSDNSLVIQTTTGDRFNPITGDIVLKQNVSENTLTLNVTQQPEHVVTPMLSIDSGSAVIGQQANKRVVTLTLTPAAAVNAAITDIIYGDLTVEFKGDTEADSPTYWEVAGPMTYLGSNQVSLTIDIGEHQWSDYFNFKLYKTSSTDTYGADSTSKSITIPHS